MTIHETNLSIVRFPQSMEAWIIKTLDNDERGGVRDTLETQGFNVYVADNLAIYIHGNFYLLRLQVGESVRTILGNDSVKAES